MSTIVATSLIEKLKEIQTKEGLSDYKFAEKLGVSHQLWQMTRTSKRELGLAVLQGIIRAYPELYRDVFLFLSGDVNITSQLVGLPTNYPQTPQDGKLGDFLSRLIVPILVLKRLFCRDKAKTDTKS